MFSFPAVYYGLALLYQKLNRFEEAIKFVEKGIKFLDKGNSLIYLISQA